MKTFLKILGLMIITTKLSAESKLKVEFIITQGPNDTIPPIVASSKDVIALKSYYDENLIFFKMNDKKNPISIIKKIEYKSGKFPNQIAATPESGWFMVCGAVSYLVNINDLDHPIIYDSRHKDVPNATDNPNYKEDDDVRLVLHHCTAAYLEDIKDKKFPKIWMTDTKQPIILELNEKFEILGGSRDIAGPFSIFKINESLFSVSASIDNATPAILNSETGELLAGNLSISNIPKQGQVRAGYNTEIIDDSNVANRVWYIRFVDQALIGNN